MSTTVWPLVAIAVFSVASAAEAQRPAAPGSSSRAGERISIEGVAEYQQPGRLVASGYRIQATPATKFSGTATTLAAVPLGFTVKVQGVVQADGSVTATAIAVSPAERSNAGRAVVTGSLEHEGKWLAGGGSIFRAALAGSATETRAPRTDPQYERVKGILERMAPGSLDESLRLHIVNSRDWNARGLPNGSIAVASGLLADMDDDEVALVLGHELAHITHRHAQKTLADAERRKAVTTFVADVMVPKGGTLTQIALTLGGAVALKAWQSGYSRSLENEADRVGLGDAAAGGFDVRKAPHVWERFREKYGDQQSVKNLLVGDHPRNEDRARSAREQLAAFYPGFVPAANAAVAAATASAAASAAPPEPSAPETPAAQPPEGRALASDPSPTRPAAAPSIEIVKGMTLDQVRALLGSPIRELAFDGDSGRQTKWVYPHLTVTFLDGRVVSVEF